MVEMVEFYIEGEPEIADEVLVNLVDFPGCINPEKQAKNDGTPVVVCGFTNENQMKMTVGKIAKMFGDSVSIR